MTTQIRAFRPLGNNRTSSFTTTAASQRTAILDTPYGTRALRVVNSGTDITFIELGIITSNAIITSSMPMLGNTVEVFTIANDIAYVAFIGAAGGNTVYITAGEGL